MTTAYVVRSYWLSSWAHERTYESAADAWTAGAIDVADGANRSPLGDILRPDVVALEGMAAWGQPGVLRLVGDEFTVARVQICEWERETWGPNEGCREFMTEPEVWTCSDLATTVVEVRGENPPWTTVLRYCDEHARELTSELAVEPADVTYVVRPIAG